MKHRMLTLNKTREPAESDPNERSSNDANEVRTVCDAVGVAFVI